MVRALAEHLPSGNATPLMRVRLLDRVQAAAAFPIALIVGPAGYGKSVLLRQYLETLRGPSVCFSVRSEHGELLSFLRGFAQAIGGYAPHALTSLAGAYERNQTSPRRAIDLARWMHAHIKGTFSGTIALDDLHHGDNDADIARFVTALIDLCGQDVTWVIASRSTSGLPVASWVTYRTADLPIDEAALRFTMEEAIEAANEAGLRIGQSEIRNLLQITEGWPAALTFALSTSTRSSDLRNISAVTREMTYRFLAEQVYDGLRSEERELLEVAVALPAIDVAVLERAGFDRALQIVEGLHERTAFVSRDASGIYRCHDLFREFLRHQSALNGREAQRRINERAARALEASGDVEHAIDAFAASGAKTDVLRLLEKHGFDLLERAQSDVVNRAINALDGTTTRENAHILALMGSMASSSGRFSRAESLLLSALAHNNDDKSVAAAASLCLAALRGNAGLDVTELLEPIADDESAAIDARAESMSLMVAKRALAGDKACEGYIEKIEGLLPGVVSDATRARVFHYLGIIERHTGSVDRAITALHHAADLSRDLHIFAIAGRCNAVLSNLMLQEYDDPVAQLKHSERAVGYAERAGDVPTLRTALLQSLSAHIRLGDDKAIKLALEQLSSIPLDEAANELIMFFHAVTASWVGRFKEAHALMSVCWDALYLDIDRVAAGAQLAVFLACDGKLDESSRVSLQVRSLLPRLAADGPFRSRSVALSVAYLALAETMNGRATAARRLLHMIDDSDPIEIAGRTVAEAFAITGGEDCLDRVSPALESLEIAGYWDASRLLRAVCRCGGDKQRLDKVKETLTISERDVLRMLGKGIVAKEIAADTGRSVHTVRAHIASAARKLNCNKQSDALEKAKKMGLL